MWTEATTGTLLRLASVIARWPRISGLATWNIVGANSRMSRLTRGGMNSGARYSDRPGSGSAGTPTTLPTEGKAGVSVRGE